MSRRQRIVLLSLLAVGLAFLYRATFRWLVVEWWGGGTFAWVARDWSHGFLVALLVGYLLWRRRREFAFGGGSLSGAPLFAGGVALHFAGRSLDALYLSAYSLVPVSLGVVCLFSGAGAARRLLVPFLLFLLAVPFPSGEWGVTGLLARVVAVASTPLARLMGTPVSRSGQLIVVGQDRYLLEPLCSGFNLIMALAALALPVLYLRGASLKRLALALLWLPLLGMVIKVVLVSTVLRLTPWLGQDAALDLYHGWLGILAYLVALAAALALAGPAAGKGQKGSLPVSPQASRAI